MIRKSRNSFDQDEGVRDREAVTAVALGWLIVIFFGAMPYWLGGTFHGPYGYIDGNSSLSQVSLGLLHSWFESMSGFTTTGATVIDPLSSPICVEVSDCIGSQPKSLLLWRSSTQWLGGMGIIMLGLMLLSRVLGGGMALARAELTGPSLSKLRPKLQETALALWSIYIVLTFLEIVLLASIGNLSIFDAFNHGLTTMPSGGFSTHDGSIGHYDSFVVEAIIICFMFLAGVNFTLIWLAWEKQWTKVFNDQEGRSYVIVIITTTAFVFFALLSQGNALDEGFFDSIFTVVSIGTSTGYTTTDYMLRPVVTHIFLFLLMIVGACAGSTSGGLKLMRVKLALKLAWREIGRIAQPKRIFRIRMNDEVVEGDRLGLVVGMLFVWTGVFALSCIILAVTMPNSNFESIIAVVASSLGNTGPTLGDYGPSNTWASLGAPSLLITSILMWFGRLELMTALLLLHPRTWVREEREAPDRASVKLIRELFEKMEDRSIEKKD